MKYNVIIPIAYKDLEFVPIVIRRRIMLRFIYKSLQYGFVLFDSYICTLRFKIILLLNEVNTEKELDAIIPC